MVVLTFIIFLAVLIFGFTITFLNAWKEYKNEDR